MAEMREVEARIAETSGAALLAVLKEMSADDRALFLKSLKRGPAPRPVPGNGPGR